MTPSSRVQVRPYKPMRGRESEGAKDCGRWTLGRRPNLRVSGWRRREKVRLGLLDYRQLPSIPEYQDNNRTRCKGHSLFQDNVEHCLYLMEISNTMTLITPPSWSNDCLILVVTGHSPRIANTGTRSGRRRRLHTGRTWAYHITLPAYVGPPQAQLPCLPALRSPT